MTELLAKKRFGSRPKGALAERQIAKLLAPWWAPVEPGCVFVRTPGSGAWGRGKARAGFRASGDLATTALLFPWVVEVKRRENWSPENFLIGRRGPVWDWWDQSCTAASEAEDGMRPLLILRKSHMPWMAVVRTDDRLCRLRRTPKPLVEIVIERKATEKVRVFQLADILALPARLLARERT